MQNKSLLWLVLGVYAIIACFTIFYFDGTAGTGDTITHFLFAKYAFQYPIFYFDHWAKPIFTLLASPFAQFGFTGIKVFNAITTLFTLYFTYRCAVMLNIKQAFLPVIFCILMPSYYILTFSGLTEPLFALFLAVGTYFLLKEKYLYAVLWVSFMPFVRSEGLIIILAFACFLLVKGKWKILPFFITGHAVYGLAGAAFHKDILWVIHKMPYRTLEHVYGKGSLFHFVDQLIYIVGLPVYGLIAISLVYYSLRLYKKQIDLKELFIPFTFFAFFVAHSLFWYFGIFASMGLKRVLIGIVPLMGIMAYHGYEFILHLLSKTSVKVQLFFKYGILLYAVIFPFTPNPAAINFKENMYLDASQQLAKKVAQDLQQKGLSSHKVISDNHYFEFLFPNFDILRALSYKDFTIQKNDILIYDPHYSRITKEHIEKTLGMKLIGRYTSINEKRQEIYYNVYQYSN